MNLMANSIPAFFVFALFTTLKAPLPISSPISYLSSIRPDPSDLVSDFDFTSLVVCGGEDDELPEQILGCVRLLKIDPFAAKPLSAYYRSKNDNKAKP